MWEDVPTCPANSDVLAEKMGRYKGPSASKILSIGRGHFGAVSHHMALHLDSKKVVRLISPECLGVVHMLDEDLGGVLVSWVSKF